MRAVYASSIEHMYMAVHLQWTVSRNSKTENKNVYHRNCKQQQLHKILTFGWRKHVYNNNDSIPAMDEWWTMMQFAMM